MINKKTSELDTTRFNELLELSKMVIDARYRNVHKPTPDVHGSVAIRHQRAINDLKAEHVGKMCFMTLDSDLNVQKKQRSAPCWGSYTICTTGSANPSYLVYPVLSTGDATADAKMREYIELLYTLPLMQQVLVDSSGSAYYRGFHLFNLRASGDVCMLAYHLLRGLYEGAHQKPKEFGQHMSKYSFSSFQGISSLVNFLYESRQWFNLGHSFLPNIMETEQMNSVAITLLFGFKEVLSSFTETGLYKPNGYPSMVSRLVDGYSSDGAQLHAGIQKVFNEQYSSLLQLDTFDITKAADQVVMKSYDCGGSYSNTRVYTTSDRMLPYVNRPHNCFGGMVRADTFFGLADDESILCIQYPVPEMTPDDVIEVLLMLPIIKVHCFNRTLQDVREKGFLFDTTTNVIEMMLCLFNIRYTMHSASNPLGIPDPLVLFKEPANPSSIQYEQHGMWEADSPVGDDDRQYMSLGDPEETDMTFFNLRGYPKGVYEYTDERNMLGSAASRKAKAKLQNLFQELQESKQ